MDVEGFVFSCMGTNDSPSLVMRKLSGDCRVNDWADGLCLWLV